MTKNLTTTAMGIGAPNNLAGQRPQSPTEFRSSGKMFLGISNNFRKKEFQSSIKGSYKAVPLALE